MKLIIILALISSAVGPATKPTPQYLPGDKIFAKLRDDLACYDKVHPWLEKLIDNDQATVDAVQTHGLYSKEVSELLKNRESIIREQPSCNWNQQKETQQESK